MDNCDPPVRKRKRSAKQRREQRARADNRFINKLIKLVGTSPHRGYHEHALRLRLHQQLDGGLSRASHGPVLGSTPTPSQAYRWGMGSPSQDQGRGDATRTDHPGAPPDGGVGGASAGIGAGTALTSPDEGGPPAAPQPDAKITGSQVATAPSSGGARGGSAGIGAATASAPPDTGIAKEEASTSSAAGTFEDNAMDPVFAESEYPANLPEVMGCSC